MKRIFILLIICMIIHNAFLYASEKKDVAFFNANQLYKEGKYQEALEKYLKLVESGHISGHLYYNMGNACFRLNSLGHSILYYERARLLMPRNADLDYNLRYVRNLTKDVIEESPGTISMIFFWLDSVTLSEMFWLFFVINIIFWVSLIVRKYKKEEWTFYLTIILLVAWIISGSSFIKKLYDIGTDNRAIVIGDEIDILSGPETGDTILFKLHAGSIVQFEREEDGWMLIRLPDEKRGWVEGKAVELINPSKIKNH